MNIPLLRQIAAKAIEFPQTFEMEDWGHSVPIDKAHPCGGVGCIAGTAILLSEPQQFQRLTVRLSSDWFLHGRKALELSESQADRLFYVRQWPQHFIARYNRSIKPKGRAKIAVERIEHFIRTEARE